MSDRELLAQRVLEDIREGIDESEMRKRHSLSAEELENIFAELDEAGLIVKLEGRYVVPVMRSISAGDMVSDVRSGMNDTDLMEKYLLTPQALANTIRLLIDGDRLARADLVGREHLFEEVLDPGYARESRRYYLDFELPVFEEGNGNQGKVHDLTTKGLGIIGIPARIDETKRLTINHEKFALINSFSFEARCRWIDREYAGGKGIAGFEIIDILPKDLQELEKLVRMVTIHVSPKNLKFQ